MNTVLYQLLLSSNFSEENGQINQITNKKSDIKLHFWLHNIWQISTFSFLPVKIKTHQKPFLERTL